MADQLWNQSPKPNVSDETRAGSNLDRHSQLTILTSKFPSGVSYAGLQSKSDEDFRRLWHSSPCGGAAWQSESNL